MTSHTHTHTKCSKLCTCIILRISRWSYFIVLLSFGLIIYRAVTLRLSWQNSDLSQHATKCGYQQEPGRYREDFCCDSSITCWHC